MGHVVYIAPPPDDQPSPREKADYWRERERAEAIAAFRSRFEYVPEIGWVGGPPMASGFATAMALGYIGVGCFASGWYVGTGLWWAATWAFFGGGL